MDDAFTKAVNHTFVEWHNKGLIYQGERLINWCTRCLTALSDEEAESKAEKGSFFHLRYPIEGREGEFVVVATTRPETMMGDTAVAVHPEDPRYKHLIGKNVLLPLTGRKIPIVADEHADPSVGLRRGEDHARPRLQRLRGREPPRPARASSRSIRAAR